jgi:hypothetical protein
MQESSARSLGKQQKILFIIGALILVALLGVIIFLSLTQKNQEQAYTATLAEITAQAEVLITQEILEVEQPTATATEVVVEETPTNLPPTATTVPPLAIVDQGLQIRCLALDSSFPTDSVASFSDTLFAVRESDPTADGFQVTIPVRACGVFVTFNRPLDGAAQVEIFQSKDTQSWYSRDLLQDETRENSYYAVLDHQYIIDPPYWNLTYRMTISDGTQTYWDGGLLVSRIFSGLCWEGSVPDPVTLKCPKADRLEREPHPDMPTLVPGGINN